VYETLDSGLGHNCILSLAIDHQGVLWVGTYNGLQKYDGTNWTLYHTNNTDQDLQIILSLAVDAHNALWVGTEWYGLKKFDGVNWTTYTDPLGYCQSASCLTFAPDGALWLSGYQPYGVGALLRFNGTEWTTFTEDQMGMFFYEVDSIGIESWGAVWAGSVNGVSRYNGANWQHYTPSNSGLSSVFIHTILIDEDDTKWFGTGTTGVCSFDDTTWEAIPLTTNGMTTNGIDCIEVDDDDRVWIGTSNSLLSYEGNFWHRWSWDELGIPNPRVLDIAVTGDHNVWVSPYNDGLLRYDGTTWTNFTMANCPLPSDNCGNLEVAPNGDLWISTNGGLVHYDGTNWQTFTPNNSGLPSVYVGDLEFDHEGNLWIIFSGTGIVCYDGQDWTLYNSAAQMPYLNMGNICHDETGSIWFYVYNEFVTEYRVIRISNGVWTVYNPSLGEIPFYGFNGGYHDQQGNFWVGTSGALHRRFAGEWTTLNMANSYLPSPYVMDIDADSAGSLWLATYGGVARYHYLPSAAVDPVTPAIQEIKAYPNPFAGAIQLDVQRSDATSAEISVYNLRGQLVTRLKPTEIKAKSFTFRWDGSDAQGSKTPNGIYLIRSESTDGPLTGRILKLN